MDIVKVQIPLFSTDPEPLCLVYPRKREPSIMQTITRETADALGDDPKGYFEAELQGGLWVIGRRVADQPW